MRVSGRLWCIIISCLVTLQVRATHIVGGDIAVAWVSGNNFMVTLTFFRDCSPVSYTFDQDINLGIYDQVTNVMMDTLIIPLSSRDTLRLGDTCFTPQNLCVERGIYQSMITIPDNPHGYYIAWQRCCRNHIILNIQYPDSAGMVFYVEIPDPALHDNSPVFGSYPNAYMCANQVNLKSFACNDAEGDSLVYSLVTPMKGGAIPSQPGQYPNSTILYSGPYQGILWQSPYNSADMIGGTPPMTINPHTGILTAQPVNIGVYVFAVRVEEYRNGVKIGEIRRDIQYQVLSCQLVSPPVFTSPVVTTIASPSATATYNLIAGDSLSFDGIVTSNNLNDSVFLYGVSDLFFPGAGGMDLSFVNDSGLGTIQKHFFLQTTCDAIRDMPYHIRFNGIKYSCYGLMTTTLDVEIYVRSPLDGVMDSIIPNVFTPNNDGKNDFFHIRATPNYCFDKFKLRIFNRWGTLVYETEDFLFQWDGKNIAGRDLPEGVYYYILDATFLHSAFNKKGVIHLRM